MPISVGFSTTEGILSWLIRKATRSPVSHAWIAFDEPVFGARMVLEATSVGFHLTPMIEWLRHNTVVRIVEVPYSLSDGLRAVLPFLGSAYDVGGLVGMIAVLLGRRLKRRWRNPLRSARTLFCSEAVTRILQGAGVPGADALDPEATSPMELLWFVSGVVVDKASASLES